MYTQYWNLKENPFLNTSDTRYLYQEGQYEEAIARFSFLAAHEHQVGILTGLHGTGKSTVLQYVATVVRQQKLPIIHMDAIPDGQLPMARHIMDQMKISGPDSSLPEALMCFTQAAGARPDALARTLLCIDDAHYLSGKDDLYWLHYLSNIRLQMRSGQCQPLFTIILAGTPDLVAMVKRVPSLSQRVQIMFTLVPLSEPQTGAYIQQHIRSVGGDMWVFEPAAIAEIFRVSNGIPRIINMLCDTALMLGFAARATQINAAIVRQAAEDTGLESPGHTSNQEKHDDGTV